MVDVDFEGQLAPKAFGLRQVEASVQVEPNTKWRHSF